jgi:hypothetical protein
MTDLLMRKVARNEDEVSIGGGPAACGVYVGGALSTLERERRP